MIHKIEYEKITKAIESERSSHLGKPVGNYKVRNVCVTKINCSILTAWSSRVHFKQNILLSVLAHISYQKHQMLCKRRAHESIRVHICMCIYKTCGVTFPMQSFLKNSLLSQANGSSVP